MIEFDSSRTSPFGFENIQRIASEPPRGARSRTRSAKGLLGFRGALQRRTLWISDVHLGTRACKADALLRFLDAVECETLYLVGDIVDGWQLKRRWYWNESQNALVAKLLERSRRGTRIVWVPGNHDEMLRSFGELQIEGIEVAREALHETADGRRLLVIHGDQFDAVVRNHRWITALGDHAYTTALVANQAFNFARRKLGYPNWSLAAHLKARVKDAVAYVGEYEKEVAREAKCRGVDGVVCGHIHQAALREIDGVLYANDGDWVESCTALMEHEDGHLELVRWTGKEAQAPLFGAAHTSVVRLAV